MNRSVLSALGFAGALALVAAPVAAQHRRGGEERGGNGAGQGQQGQQRQESRQPESRQPESHASQPAQAPPTPRVEAGAVPRQGVERAVPRQEVERSVPRQGVERAVPRQQGAGVDNRRYDNRRYGYAAPRYVGPRYYSGRYNGPRYGGPLFTIAPRRFYRPVPCLPAAVQRRFRSLGRLSSDLLRSLLLSVRLLPIRRCDTGLRRSAPGLDQRPAEPA